MKSIDYRAMQFSDYPQVFTLWQATENIGLRAADQPENIAFFLQRNPGLSFIALQGSDLIGAILSGHNGRSADIYHLAVSVPFRGAGVGRHLVNLCLQGLRSVGIERCHIHVFAHNQAGLEFWQKLGWYLRPELALLSYDVSAQHDDST